MIQQSQPLLDMDSWATIIYALIRILQYILHLSPSKGDPINWFKTPLLNNCLNQRTETTVGTETYQLYSLQVHFLSLCKSISI